MSKQEWAEALKEAPSKNIGMLFPVSGSRAALPAGGIEIKTRCCHAWSSFVRGQEGIAARSRDHGLMKMAES